MACEYKPEMDSSYIAPGLERQWPRKIPPIGPGVGGILGHIFCVNRVTPRLKYTWPGWTIIAFVHVF